MGYPGRRKARGVVAAWYRSSAPAAHDEACVFRSRPSSPTRPGEPAKCPLPSPSMVSQAGENGGHL